MKKFVLLLLVFSVLFIAGCQTTPMESTTAPVITYTEPVAAPSSETDSTTAPYEYAAVPLIAVSVPSLSDESKSESGDSLFTYSRQSLTLVHPDQVAADKIIVDFLKRQDAYDQIASGMHDDAAAAYNSTIEWTPHQLDVHLNPVRIDRAVLSFFGSSMRYSGGIHPERTGISLNYDMLTGDVLTLAGILTGSEKASEIARLAIEVLDAQRESDNLYEGFESIVENAIKNDPTHNESWFLTRTGLCFYFSPYEIAPYSSGIITAVIPYEKLVGLLYDGYFPVEEDISSGKIILQNVTGVLGEDADILYPNIAELILSEEGKQLMLYSDGLVQDLSVTVMSYLPGQDSGPLLEHTYSAFMADAIGPDTAVMIQTETQDENMTVCIRYISGGEEIQHYLTFENGSFALTDPA